MFLPRSSHIAQPRGPAHTTTIQRGSETILLVEDEDEVRAVARRVLVEAGYGVLEAANAGQAIAIEAGQQARERYLRRHELAIESKGVQNFVSEADRLCEATISGAIAGAFPNDSIIGEEHGVLDRGGAAPRSRALQQALGAGHRGRAHETSISRFAPSIE